MTPTAVRSFATFSAVVFTVGFSGCFKDPYMSCNEECVGNARRMCDGFQGADGRGDLEECGPSRHCVESTRSYGYYAACALRGPDPRCNPETNDFFCDGRKIVECHGAYPTKEFDCASKGLFCASDLHEADCVVDGTPEPRCDDTGGRTRLSFCDGQRLVFCLGRFVHERFSGLCNTNGAGPCVEFPRTEDDPAHASCEPPAKPP